MILQKRRKIFLPRATTLKNEIFLMQWIYSYSYRNYYFGDVRAKVIFLLEVACVEGHFNGGWGLAFGTPLAIGAPSLLGDDGLLLLFI